MIYQVNGYNNKPTFYVDQATHDANPNFSGGTLVVGTQADAQNVLSELQQKVLAYEAVRFSICATFVNGNDTTWREIQESDPEDTICQVFDTFTGQYTQCSNKTEAFALNKQKQQNFLASIGLDSIVELNEMPIELAQPISKGTQNL